MRKLFHILLSVLLIGTLATNAMAFRLAEAGSCTIGKCCCTPSARTPATPATLPCGMDKIVPDAFGRAACCHPAPVAPNSPELVLPARPRASAHLPGSGLVSHAGQRGSTNPFNREPGSLPDYSPDKPPGIPLYMLTLSIRC